MSRPCVLQRCRLQSFSGEIEVGSYGFTVGMYTERAAELLRVGAVE